MSPNSTSPRTSARSGGNRLVVGLVAVAIVAFVGVVAVLSANEGADLPSLAEYAGTVTVAGEPVPPIGEDGSDPFAGQVSAPVLTVQDLADGERVLGAPGQAQVLVFLAHWCPVCDQELPVLRRVIDRGDVPADVELVLVTTALDPSRPNWSPDRWLADAGLGGVLTVRDDTAGRAFTTYGLRAYPAWAAIDADGVVVARRQGLLPETGIVDLLGLVSGVTG
jgi:cytochrome c biogenesis protein CcmG, thiol:disulfide interchange protein DsbE